MPLVIFKLQANAEKSGFENHIKLPPLDIGGGIRLSGFQKYLCF